MNRKLILLFSLIVVAIGVGGILTNSEDNGNTLTDLVESKKEKDVKIVLAQSTHTLSSGRILTKDDYALKTVIVPESSELIKSDVSNLENISNHLLKSNVLTGSYITHEILVSPDSNEFRQLMLKNGEIIYKFNIMQQDEYLLDTLSIGDLLSFQLRTLETDKRKGIENSITINTKDLNDRKEQNYSLTKIISNMRVVRIKKYSSSELSERNSNNQKTEDASHGYIDVIINTEELNLIHIAEKAGDVFLIPNTKFDDENHKTKSLHDILPKLRTIRELRG
ncbi:tight adherance operon protein [Yersinia aleksiciae]|uniref:tight adherance operon protein n=1 Tax=Yersinia aleksiciae TaxID=263819 RepID=UPI00119CC7B0|nr:tight adherance operon protein [Yersinia aleksiciae]MDN0122211.1 tight adherance operon protein [Yersinia aleksiciae]